MAKADAIGKIVGAAAPGWLFLACALLGCASSGVGRAGFRDPEHGYWLPHPEAVDGSPWQAQSIEDAAVAYRGPHGAYMALKSNCESEPVEQDPAVLARQLLVGIENRTRVESESLEFAGGHAYAQLIEARADDQVVRTRTVTLVRSDCVLDWVLAVAAGHPEIEACFERWWRGFRPDAEPTPVETQP